MGNRLVRRVNGFVIVAAAAISASALAADGGWQAQVIPLQEGWNLVWLEVAPTPDDPSVVFGALLGGDPVLERAWTFVPSAGAAPRGQWLVYDPSAPAFVNTLSSVQGARPYFLKLSAAPADALTVVGRPRPRQQSLSQASGSLLGAATDTGTTYGDLLAFSGIDAKITAIHRFDPDAIDPDFEYVEADLDDPLPPSVASWLNIGQTFPYDGPIRVGGPAEGCQFGTDGYLDKLAIEIPVVNDAGPAETITVKVLPSATPPPGEPADAGATLPGGPTSWLQWWDPVGGTNKVGAWADFPRDGVVLKVPPGQAIAKAPDGTGGYRDFELRARRSAVPAASTKRDNALYQALLEITDTVGNRKVVAAGMEKLSSVGTWTGTVRLTDVAFHPLVPVPEPPKGREISTAAKPMEFAIVLEIDEAGGARLLDRACVAVARDDATMMYTFNPVLFPEAVPLVGTLESAEGVTGSVTMSADHPLNPYRHRYNPKLQLGYELTREITMTIDEQAFLDAVEDQLVADTVLNSGLVGVYTEVVTGLLGEGAQITSWGTFSMRRLDDGVGLDVLCACGHPDAGKCTQGNGTPGCEDPACCALVCEVDPTCCSDEWDASCVTLASELCTGP